jgi:indolepyruvate ferredoxin oxidoreductase
VELAVELASLPERIRGFGHVKEKSLPPVLERWAALEAELADPAVGEGVRRAA